VQTPESHAEVRVLGKVKGTSCHFSARRLPSPATLKTEVRCSFCPISRRVRSSGSSPPRLKTRVSAPHEKNSMPVFDIYRNYS
jgi:hypothetical protein